jgi:uncharacterized membrane protein YadS
MRIPIEAMKEMSYIIVGLAILGMLAIILWFTNMPETIEDTDIQIIIALGIGLLIMVLDKRQDLHFHEIIQNQNKMISEIHVTIMQEKVVVEEIRKILDK